MDADPPVVTPTTHQETVAWTMVRRRESSVAVVNGKREFVGLVPPHRMLGALLAEHDEDIARLGGYLASTERARQAAEEPVGRRLWHRLPWAEAGSERGAEVLKEVPTRPAAPSDERRADQAVERAASQQVRSLDTSDIRDLLYSNLEHPRWDDVADRCLSCGNCTQVCPTCFCSTVEDVTDLAGESAERVRHWDSCFSLDHSYVHGGSVRSSTRSRYRQWMTHKLATWIDQFGTSGCIGCGRCITWCPVAIDLTEEVAAIRATDSRGGQVGADD